MLNQDLRSQLKLPSNFRGSTQVDVRSKDSLDIRPRSPANVSNQQQPQQPDSQAAQEVNLVLLKEKPLLKKITKEGSTSYKYIGPVNHRIHDFLEDLYRREGPMNQRGPFEKLSNLNKRIDKRLEKIFPKSCTNGPLSLDKDSILLFFLLLAGAIYYSVKIEAATDGLTSDAMQILRVYGTLYTFLFIIYGIIFLSLPIWWAFTVFVLQTTIPVFLILFDLNLIFPRDDVPDIDYVNTAVRACVALLPVYWGVMYPAYKLIRQHVGRFVAHIFIAVIFLGIMIFALGVPALDLLTGKETLDVDYLKDHSEVIYIVCAIVVVLSWLIAHMKYFWVPTPVLENTLMEMAQRQARKLPSSKSQDVVREGLIAVPTMKQRFMRNVYWISSVIVGSVYIALEMFLLDSIIKSVETSSTDGLVMSIAFFALTPIFLLIGIPIAMTKARVRNKTLILPLIVMLPMFGVIPLSNTVEESTDTSNFSLFLIVGLPLIMFFWLGMAFLGLKGRRMFYAVLTFMCLFFFLPFVFLGLSESDYFAEAGQSFKAVFYSFIGIFGFVTVVLLSFKAVKALLLFTKKKLSERRKRLQKEKENEERIKALRKKKQEKKAGGLYDDDNEDEDDDLEMEELEKNGGVLNTESNHRSRITGRRRTTLHPSKVDISGKKRSSVFPSRADVDEKKRSGVFSSKSDLESKKDLKVKGSRAEVDANEGDNPDNAVNAAEEYDTEKKAQKQLNLLKEVEGKRRMQLVKLMYLNFKNFGFWINAAAFIVSYTFVAYTYFNLPSTSTETEKGVLLGVTIVMPIIFILNNLLIRLKTAKLSAEERKVYSSKKDNEKVFFQSQLRKDEIRLSKATIYETYSLMMGVLVIPILQIPLFIVFTDRQAFITNLFIMIISIVFSVFLAGMIEIKKRTGPYNRFFIPSFVSLCWVMVLLPFVVIIPLVATVLENDSDDFKIFVKASLTGSAFLLMFGVTFFAIVINVIFQKLEKEKLIKFIIKMLQRTLKEHSIKADDVVLRRLVEDFLNKDTEEEVEAMKNEIIYDKIPLVPIYPPKFKVTPLYAAGIILMETYNKILRAQETTKNKEKNPKKKKKEDLTRANLFAWLAALCEDKDGDEEEKEIEDNFEEDGIQEIGGDFEDSYFKADHYLPKDMGENIWNYALGSVTPDMVSHHHTNMTEEDDVPDDYHPVLGLKPTEVDYNLKDAMTPVLKTITVKTLSSGEIRKLNNNEHALMMYDSMNQMEVWYQHVYDYFSGKTDPDLQNPSQGLIFQNFLQFLRITELNQNQEVSDKQLQSTFALHATKKAEKGCCLAYSGFVQLLTLVASKAILESDDSKLLRRFTKKIYPVIMSRIPSIAKSYTGAMISFGKSKTPYVPHLDLFDKTKVVSIAQDISEMNANDYVIKRREVRKSNAHVMKQINEEPPAAIPLSNLILRTTPTPKHGNMSSESFFSHGDRSPSRLKAKKKSCIKRTFRKMFLSLNACWLSFSSKMEQCINTCFVRYPKEFGDWVYRKTKRVGKALGFDIDVESDDEDLAIRRVTTEAPSWPIVVDKMFSIIPKAQILYFQRQGQKGVTLQFNLTNLLAVVGKVSEIYGFMAFAFRTEIPWFEDNLASDVILATNVEISVWNSFVFLFWTAVGLVFLYLMISIPAIHHLRKGTLGQDEQGRKASFPHPQFFLTLAVTVLGGSLFTQIMRYLLEAFVCDYSTTPWSLVKDSSIECLSDEHSLYMGIGVLALLIYYPISTFMFPNFQFQSKPLDLKYDPTYLVIQIQARLIITGFITFFKVNDSTDTASIITQLIGTSSTLFLLAIASLALKPCLIQKANIWDAGGYSAAAWVNICAIVVVVLRNSVLGAIMLGCGIVIIIGLTIYVVKKYYGTKSKKRKDLLGYVNYDPVKRQALIPEEYKPQPVVPQPQAMAIPQPQVVMQPRPEVVRKRSLSILDNLKADVSLAYVDKNKIIF